MPAEISRVRCLVSLLMPSKKISIAIINWIFLLLPCISQLYLHWIKYRFWIKTILKFKKIVRRVPGNNYFRWNIFFLYLQISNTNICALLKDSAQAYGPVGQCSNQALNLLKLHNWIRNQFLISCILLRLDTMSCDLLHIFLFLYNNQLMFQNWFV